MRGVLDSFSVLKGIPIAKTIIINNESDLEKQEFPYFMKIDSGEHKLKLGGVFRCRNINEAQKNYKILQKKFKGIQIIIQEEILGIELIIGIKEDEVFNKTIMFGLGGTFVEEKGDITFRSLPISKNEIIEMLDDLPFIKALIKKSYPIKKLINLIYDICTLAQKKKITELDLNPVIINKDGVFIVDARISLL